jgi:non-ribosomal peptide synthetase component F
VYIIDSQTRGILPVGFTGEICICGAGVALGYLDPKINKEKFVADPFDAAKDIARGWKRMY